MKKTKIVCTLGPSSDNYDTLKAMYEAGMNIARINMSHGTHESHQQKIDLVKQLRNDLGKPFGLMLDTKGPEVRIRTFENGSIEISEGADFIFTTKDIIGNEKAVSVTYENLHNEISVNDQILVNDGLLVFKVTDIKQRDIHARCIVGGAVSNNKGMHFPDTHLNLTFLSERDKSDLMLAVKNDVDFVAASFVNSAKDINEMREFLVSQGLKDCKIIAKIESKIGLENLQEITEASDGTMVARGDLGVELEYYKLPKAQKDMISVAKLSGKDVIVATEMLESMINKVRPTRAEISDVANAVYDEASAVMLSGETAMGKYPVQVVKVMANICQYAEDTINYQEKVSKRVLAKYNKFDELACFACNEATKTGAKAIVVFEDLGLLAHSVSKFKLDTPVIAVVQNAKSVHQLSVCWGVDAVAAKHVFGTKNLLEFAKQEIINRVKVTEGDKFVVLNYNENDDCTVSIETI